MTQALITVNGSPGSDTDLPIDTLVQLNNTGNGGESTYLWTILDQPPGAADALSSTSIQNPTLTPKKEDSYLIQLIVNQGLADERVDRVVVAVRRLKTRIRVPAAGETTEVDSADGYASDANEILRLVDTVRADPGLVVAQLAYNAALHDIVRFTTVATIKSTLPGEEIIPVADLAVASASYVLAEALGIVVGPVAEGGTILTGDLVYVRVHGQVVNVSLVGITTGDVLFVSDAGRLARVAGTNEREIAKALTGSADVGSVHFGLRAGVAAISSNLSNATPADIGASAPGVAGLASRDDHVHAHGNQAGASLHAVATPSVAGFMSAADKTALDGLSAGVPSNTPPVNVTKAAASAGAASEVSRQDHKHDITTATAVELTDSTNAEGAATSLARSNHTHAHGNRSGGSLHAAAAGDVGGAGAAGFATAAHINALGGFRGVNAQTGTAYTAVADDAGKVITRSNVGASTQSIPTNAVTPYPIGTVLPFFNRNVGEVTIDGAGTTLVPEDGKTLVMRTPSTTSFFTAAFALKVDTNEWLVYGDLVLV